MIGGRAHDKDQKLQRGGMGGIRGGVLAGMMEGVEQLLGRSCASWGLTLFAQAVEWSQSGE